MPNLKGAGPYGSGAMTGGGSGSCGGAQAKGLAHGRGYGPDCGFGHGCGRGIGHGSGRGMGHAFGQGRGLRWFSVGYGAGGEEAAASNAARALEGRRAYLRAELARTESLLGEIASKGGEPRS